MTTSIFSSKEEIRKTYPEIWEKLQGMKYEYDNFSFPLVDNKGIMYCETSKQGQFVCLNLNYNQRVFSTYSRHMYGLHLEHF